MPEQTVYTPNFMKSPVEIALGLINHDNNKSYAPADVKFKAPVALVEHESGKNTAVEVDLLVDPSEVDGDYVEFTYDRVDLEGLFSEVVAEGLNKQREVIVIDNGTLDKDTFISEVARIYGVQLNKVDFDITLQTATRINVAAAAGNLAYIGELDFNIDVSLASRVTVTDLAGFTGIEAE